MIYELVNMCPNGMYLHAYMYVHRKYIYHTYDMCNANTYKYKKPKY